MLHWLPVFPKLPLPRPVPGGQKKTRFRTLPASAWNRTYLPSVKYVRWFGYHNEDLSIYKDTYFTDGRYVRLQADASNVLNRVVLCPPGTGLANGNFVR